MARSIQALQTDVVIVGSVVYCGTGRVGSLHSRVCGFGVRLPLSVRRNLELPSHASTEPWKALPIAVEKAPPDSNGYEKRTPHTSDLLCSCFLSILFSKGYRISARLEPVRYLPIYLSLHARRRTAGPEGPAGRA